MLNVTLYPSICSIFSRTENCKYNTLKTYNLLDASASIAILLIPLGCFFLTWKACPITDPDPRGQLITDPPDPEHW
jgi:hypothetical protein